jgi:hypothetical protein
MNYFTYKNEKFTCKNCNWQGTGEETTIGEYFDAGYEIDCPNCGESLPGGLVVFPSLEETAVLGNEMEQKEAQELLAQRERFEAARLKNPEQLPHLDGDELIFHMSEVKEGGDGFMVFKYDEKEVWRELCYYEYYDRYIAIGEIMIEKYGERLKDIIPKVNGIYFYGDTLKAPGIVEEFRIKKFKQNEG